MQLFNQTRILLSLCCPLPSFLPPLHIKTIRMSLLLFQLKRLGLVIGRHGCISDFGLGSLLLHFALAPLVSDLLVFFVRLLVLLDLFLCVGRI
jgi:hypothetical protein